MVHGYCYDCYHHEGYTNICELTGERMRGMDHCCYFRLR